METKTGHENIGVHCGLGKLYGDDGESEKRMDKFFKGDWADQAPATPSWAGHALGSRPPTTPDKLKARSSTPGPYL